jgi:hypothetical protein
MPCFLLLIILLFPRVALALMWFFSTYLQRAFHGGLVLDARSEYETFQRFADLTERGSNYGDRERSRCGRRQPLQVDGNGRALLRDV